MLNNQKNSKKVFIMCWLFYAFIMFIFVWFRFENIKLGYFLKNLLFNLVFIAKECTLFAHWPNFRVPRLMERSNTSVFIFKNSVLSGRSAAVFYWPGTGCNGFCTGQELSSNQHTPYPVPFFSRSPF